MSVKDERTRSQKKADKKLRGLLERGMSNGDTRALFRWVLDLSGVFSADNTGRRDVGLDIITAMNAVDPYQFVLLMKEGADELVQLRIEGQENEDDDE